MCAHYTIFIEQDELRDIVAAAEKNLSPTLNFKMAGTDVFPKYIAPVLVPEDGKLVPTAMRWGYPLRQKKAKQKDPLNPEYTTKAVQNAKLETAQESRFWQDSLEKRRCLIPASGFYEWQTTSEGKKVPYYFLMPTTKNAGCAGRCGN